MKKKQITKALLERYYAGQCSQEEKRIVEEWLQLEQYDEPLQLDEQSKARYRNLIWQSIAADVSSAEQTEPIPLYRRALPYAAAVALLFTLSVAIHFFVHTFSGDRSITLTDYEIVETQRGEKRTVTLSDGSTIRMNYETEIRVPEQFQGDERIVYLTGHAHFDVVRDEKRPFIIYTEDSKTQVLGTSFDINTKQEGETEIIVTSGKVAFSDKGQEHNPVTLTLNNRAVLGADNRIVTDEVDALTLTAWKDNRLVLKDKTLKEIVSILEPWFDVQVTVESRQLLDDRFNLSLNNPPLTGVLERLAFMGSFDYQVDGKKVIIR